MKDKNTQTDVIAEETKSIRITEAAHSAAKIHVAKTKGINLCEYVSDLIMKDAKRKK